MRNSILVNFYIDYSLLLTGTPKLMPSSILFFPPSFPDETLHSRVSRYHFLSGNKTASLSFIDIFDAIPFPLDIVVPKQIVQLAGRLPGVTKDNLHSLLKNNTLLPLFTPFLGTKDTIEKSSTDTVTDSLTRIPRRVVGLHGAAKLCIECCESDAIEHGSSYWHRAHQIPGVSSCWKHGKKLIRSCPFCSKPFSIKNQFLTLPWVPCECGWAPDAESHNELASTLETEYAVFSKELLHGELPSIPQEALANHYRSQAYALEFRAGSLVSQASLLKAIVETFGEEFLSQADPAYAAKKTKTWIRLSTIDNQLDMPITRHLILSFFLFREFNIFKSHIKNKIAASNTRRRKDSYRQPETSDSKRSTYRNKIQKILNRWPNSTLEDCWKNARQATSWLFANDKKWLISFISGKTSITDSTISKSDLPYAKLINDGIETLYSTSSMPERVNVGKILSLLPKRLAAGSKERQEKYPEVSKKIIEYYESLWHFHVRRILWGIFEIKRLELKPTVGNLSELININKTSCNSIIDHFDWNIEAMASQAVENNNYISRTGISRQWLGPAGIKASYGGRAYQKARI